MIDQQVIDALRTVLKHSDARRHLHDDEHRDPLPIHGSARWFDRRPVVARVIGRKENLRITRGMMEQEWAEMFPGTNNEAGD